MEVAAAHALSKDPSKKSEKRCLLQGNLPKDPLRPGELFYGKLIPALKEQGITNVMSRKDWPIDVMREVFNQLKSETPR